MANKMNDNKRFKDTFSHLMTFGYYSKGKSCKALTYIPLFIRNARGKMLPCNQVWAERQINNGNREVIFVSNTATKMVMPICDMEEFNILWKSGMNNMVKRGKKPIFK